MKHYLTSDKTIQQTLNECLSFQLEVTINNLKEKYKDIFTGAGKHKYRQVELHVDQAVQQVAENQGRTLYAIRDLVSELLRILEKNDLIENLGGPTDWVSNSHVTTKPVFDTRNIVED
eukprot:gene13458-14842_t